MFGLLTSLSLLGLSAVDPIGIAAMPILLTQKRPFLRSFMFLGGSFVALVVMGMVFAQGFGERVLRFENNHTWIVPTVEIIAGLILLGIAASLVWKVKTKQVSAEPSDNLTKRLQLSNGKLFILGAALVTVQSIVDVVFVIAMIRAGEERLSSLGLLAGVTSYAVAALVLQLAVVVAYKLTPFQQREQTLKKVHYLLTRYANQTLIGISLVLGGALLLNGVFTQLSWPHF